MGPIGLACIWLGGAAFVLLIMLLAVGMSYEWLRMCQVEPGPRPVLTFAALPVAVVLAAIDDPLLGLGLIALVFGVASFRPAAGVHARLFPWGLPYIGIGAVALTWLRIAPVQGLSLVIVLLLVVWASDIGAYLVGRIVGGPRLAPRISPGKTWSGAIGGLLASMLVGLIAAVPLGAGQHAFAAALLAGVLGVIGQAGDLLESGLKRRVNVKDSSNLIPGHGGLLDRFDAVLTAAPTATILALVVGRGVIIWQ
ncbi:MAG: phosphatidate cytidylyltransferase [Proteobacteria bacterium]|nr:phosphatidate cytidylyltransferase [Pseudomonadota bacterium]